MKANKFLAIWCYGLAMAAMVCALFAAPELGKIGWVFAFMGWWLVGVSFHAKSGKRSVVNK